MNCQERQSQVSKSLNGLIGILPPEDAPSKGPPRSRATFTRFNSSQINPQPCSEEITVVGSGFLEVTFLLPPSLTNCWFIDACLLVQYTAIFVDPSKQLCLAEFSCERAAQRPFLSR